MTTFEHDGKFYDPFKIERVMNAVLQGDIPGTGAKMASEIPEVAHLATEQVKRAVCLAFDLAPWDVTTGTGSNEQVVMGIWEAFLDWREKKKAEYRERADIASVFGTVAAGLDGTGEALYGLWLNLGRIRYQQAEAVRLGVEAAYSDMPLPMTWFEGIAPLAEQEQEIAYRINAERSERRAARRKVRGG